MNAYLNTYIYYKLNIYLVK